MHNIVVLISGNGSNLQAIIDAVAAGRLPTARVSLVVSNKAGAFGLERAKKAAIPTLVKTLKSVKDQGKTRVDYDIELAADIKATLGRLAASSSSSSSAAGDSAALPVTPDLVVLAGFMHILSPDFISSFPQGRIINLHPALPGAFDGAHAIDRAFDSFKRGEITHTGIMVHKVIPEVDRGEVIVQRVVPILESDTLETLEERIHSNEHTLLIEGIQSMLATIPLL